MKQIERYAFLGAIASACLIAAACNDEEKAGVVNEGTGGSSAGGGGAGGGTATGGKAVGGTTSSGGASTGGGKATGGSGPDSGTGGGAAGDAGGDGSSTACDLSGTGKTKQDIPNPVTADTTLAADKVWTVKDIVHVNAGATLTIEPCTRIEGTKNPIGVLVITKGGKIMAEGTKDQPILFTSEQSVGSRAAGDWGGVILLGQATNNDANDELIEGLADQPENHHGGTDDADNSGSMKYVRIEYAGFQLAPDVEVNGLTMGSVGSGTQISYIEVNHGLDDCFEWFGGTVNVDHIVCNADGDDMFDMDRGYRGTLDTAFGRKRANPSADPNGFEWDNNKTNNANTPVTHPTAKNITMCGFGVKINAGATVSYGMVLRRGITGVIDNVVTVGFDYGVDTRDDVGTNAAPALTITNSTFFDMVTGATTPIANATETDNDNTFDETAWFNAGAGNNTTDPGFTDLECNPIADNAPPDPKVLNSAKGAFKDGASWLDGKWISWEDK
jgi:hypothetical protein